MFTITIYQHLSHAQLYTPNSRESKNSTSITKEPMHDQFSYILVLVEYFMKELLLILYGN